LSFDRNVPYNDLPDLPPSARIETIPILKMTVRANKAIAELKISGQLIPNQAVLIQALGLSEAKISSEIENIVTTNEDYDKLSSNLAFRIFSNTALRYSAAGLSFH
jgi:Fic family protein